MSKPRLIPLFFIPCSAASVLVGLVFASAAISSIESEPAMQQAATQSAPATRPAQAAPPLEAEELPAARPLLLDARFGEGRRVPVPGWRDQRQAILYASAFWLRGTDDKVYPAEDRWQYAMRQFSRVTATPMVLDIEHLRSPEERKLLASILAEWRRRVPGQRIALYGELPDRNWWAPVASTESLRLFAAGEPRSVSEYDKSVGYRWETNRALLGGEKMRQWRAANDATADVLLAHVDDLCPSLYVMYPDAIASWVDVAILNLTEARRIAARKPGMRVIAFVSPFVEGRPGGDYIGDEAWRLVLLTVYIHADGVIVWAPLPDTHPATRVMVDFTAAVEGERRSRVPTAPAGPVDR